ncbi:nucleotidyltransferase family protein [Candidatus Bathyarchaeota archaeon]|nr:nucleotidyltransferase family protein [Candidatus Bathyarchaeota archaeon]MBS7618457.1 nucleotidyltransferase family protein [Candidatus Bathyarchaeota archaeon]
MKSLEEIKSILAEHKNELRERFKVKGIGIFGSFVRGEQKKRSDIDILVEFEEPPSLFEFMDLEDYLSKLLGLKVDLVTRDSLKPRIGEHILREVVYL